MASILDSVNPEIVIAMDVKAAVDITAAMVIMIGIIAVVVSYN
jgi:hypothetical protein